MPRPALYSRPARPTLPDEGARIWAMFLQALGRPPTAEESGRARSFLTWTAAEGTAAPWAELAHAMFNLKEFIFIR